MSGEKRIPISKPYLTSKEEHHLVQAFRSGWISSIGAYIRDFETGVACRVGAQYGIAASNGTTALHLALLACGVGPGDEVIVPALTFVASANAVVYCGAKPVFVDISEETLCVDPRAVSDAVTDRTKAILPVHLYGFPAPMDEINAIAKQNLLMVVEDAAESLGAKYKGRMSGNLGDCGVFSFYGNKIITTGEGGMITTDSAEIHQRAAHLRDHAMLKDKRYWHDEVGYNYRMTNLQAAVGVGQLENFDFIVVKRQSILKRYRNRLHKIPGIRLNREQPDVECCPWFLCIDGERFANGGRDRVCTELGKVGVETRPYFHPLTNLPMFKGHKAFPVAENLSKQGMNLPLFPDLTDSEVDFICEQFDLICRNFT